MSDIASPKETSNPSEKASVAQNVGIFLPGNNGAVAGDGPDSTVIAQFAEDGSRNGTGDDVENEGGVLAPVQSSAEPPYSIFTEREKIVIVMTVSFMALISPLSGAIYLPALPEISKDLHVSHSLVNLTITTYMIFQGLAPSLIGNISDIYGRRPAYLICCVFFLAANIALALENSYPALITLRCLQSLGSSATISLSNATSADLVTRAQRGRFVSYASLGTTLGPAIGPVIGGLITQKLGWKATFWFLAILSGALFAIIFVFLPETCRAIVGNGSVPPPKWNMSVMGYVNQRRARAKGIEANTQTIKAGKRRPNPLASLKILLEKDGGVALGYASLMFAGYFAILTTLSAQLSDRFGYDSITIGLCYLPIGVGNIVSRWINGFLLDANFKRTARKLGVAVDKNRQQSLDDLPIHRIRLQVYIPEVYISCVLMIAYGWAMDKEAPLAVIEVILFLCGAFFTSAVTCINVLIIDTHPESAATASAAGNLSRCLVSAAATAFATPMINKIGIGWTCVFFAGVWVVFSPVLWMVMIFGQKWQRETQRKNDAKQKERETAERINDVEDKAAS